MLHHGVVRAVSLPCDQGATFGRRSTYVGRPTALNRCITAFVSGSSGSSAWNLIFTYGASAEITVGFLSVVLSLVSQFLHPVAPMSMRTVLPSLIAAARPSASHACPT